MASRRASAPCRSDIFARSCPEKRLQNACREFWSTLVMSGSGESCVLDGRKFLARSKCADYCGGGNTQPPHRPRQGGGGRQTEFKTPPSHTPPTSGHPTTPPTPTHPAVARI